MSDTHNQHEQIERKIDTFPEGDIFIHAGDISRYGELKELQKFTSWVKKLNFKYKIIIAGNRELLVDPMYVYDNKKRHLEKPKMVEYFKTVRRELTNNPNFIYLENESIELSFDETTKLKIFGTPNTCKGGSHSAFKLPSNIISRTEHWQRLIPTDTDILISHGPPASIGDFSVSSQTHCGCPALFKEIVERVRPKLTVFGHIHEARGVYKGKIEDSEMILANVASVDKAYQPRDSLVEIDLPV